MSVRARSARPAKARARPQPASARSTPASPLPYGPDLIEPSGVAASKSGKKFTGIPRPPSHCRPDLLHRMPVSKDQAIEIARNWVQSRCNAPDALQYRDSPHIGHERGGYGTTHLGMSASYWVLVFELVQPPDRIISPGELIVYVDEHDGHLTHFRGP